VSESLGTIRAVTQLPLDPAIDQDPLGLALFYVETPFHHYLAGAEAVDLSAMGDTEEEALRELALLLLRWAADSVEQELDPNEPSLRWHERSLVLRLLEATDLDQLTAMLRRRTASAVLRDW
jgi:hypothetical protein